MDDNSKLDAPACDSPEPGWNRPPEVDACTFERGARGTERPPTDGELATLAAETRSTLFVYPGELAALAPAAAPAVDVAGRGGEPDAAPPPLSLALARRHLSDVVALTPLISTDIGARMMYVRADSALGLDRGFGRFVDWTLKELGRRPRIADFDLLAGRIMKQRGWSLAAAESTPLADAVSLVSAPAPEAVAAPLTASKLPATEDRSGVRRPTRGGLESRALAELATDPHLTYAELARRLGCAAGTLKDRRRCPELNERKRSEREARVVQKWDRIANDRPRRAR